MRHKKYFLKETKINTKSRCFYGWAVSSHTRRGRIVVRVQKLRNLENSFALCDT